MNFKEFLKENSKKDIIKELEHMKNKLGVKFVTYGDSDLGIPVAINDAIKDFKSMDDELVGKDAEVYACDSTGKILEI